MEDRPWGVDLLAGSEAQLFFEPEESMRNLNVWAYQAETRSGCAKAGLDVDPKLSYPAGNEHGQAGWDVAVKYQDLADLAKLLSGGLAAPPRRARSGSDAILSPSSPARSGGWRSWPTATKGV